MLRGLLNAFTFNLINNKGPLLYQAIKDGDEDKVGSLLSGYIIPAYSTIKNSDANTIPPFSLAIELHNPGILLKLLEHYQNNISEDEKHNALRNAARNGHAAIVTTLLDRCGDVIYPYTKGETLSDAAKNGHAAIVTTLLDRCSDVIEPRFKGYALQNAAENGHVQSRGLKTAAGAINTDWMSYEYGSKINKELLQN
ncbi:MAG: hypothetical protein U1E78_12465 [Gammaproteobacteria bacterium]